LQGNKFVGVPVVFVACGDVVCLLQWFIVSKMVLSE
jgi:hypothetical protein